MSDVRQDGGRATPVRRITVADVLKMRQAPWPPFCFDPSYPINPDGPLAGLAQPDRDKNLSTRSTLRAER